MKIKKGFKWKSIEGPSKGSTFVVIEITSDVVTYRSIDTKSVYVTPRKHFDKYQERVKEYWYNKKKRYKLNKANLKNE